MKKFLFSLIVGLLFFVGQASAQLNVSISGATQAPIPVAFPKIMSDNSGSCYVNCAQAAL